MVEWKFKSCPRCAGDIFLNKDMDGWYEQCLQCGYRRDPKGILEVKQKVRTDKGRLTMSKRRECVVKVD